MQSIKAKQGQTLLDMALEQAGTVEAAWDIALANGMALTDVPGAGTALLLPHFPENAVRAYYRAHRISPASVFEEVAPVVPGASGIGFWQIGVDFIVS